MSGPAGRRFVLSVLACTVVIVACSETQPAVNRVQPNAIEKAVFNGTWYHRKTVIDLSYSSGITWVGDQGGVGSVEKIVWDIQEKYLIARRSYERVQASEPEGISEATEPGAAVAMYRIESHFDIRREYDPVTGERLNVVSENDLDRPWYEREYMRVDWSQNLITDWQFLTSAKLLGRLQLDPVSYFVQDLEDDHPHRPKFERNPDTNETYYIDVVNKVFAQPERVKVPGYEEGIPHCFFFHTSFIDCAANEITVRNAFLKVDETRDYQPKQQTGDRMARAGFFYVDRPGYDPDYGVVEPARHRFYVRHNLWQKSHRQTEEGDFIRCTEANQRDVCQGNGSVCDLDWARARGQRNEDGAFEGICTLPYREREIRPIAYHVSSNFPERLFEYAQKAVEQWNDALTEAVGSLREIECLNDDANEAKCAAERTRKDAQNIFILCHNPVDDDDPKACGEPGIKPQVGDLRYSLLGWVDDPHLRSPLGYGPPSADPETGEIISASAMLYGAAFERVISFGKDVVALLLGDLDEAQIRRGDQVEAWIQRIQKEGTNGTVQKTDDRVVKIDGQDVDRINTAMDFSWAHRFGTTVARPQGSGMSFVERISKVRRDLAREGAFGGQNLHASSTNLIGTDIEYSLTNAEALLASGFDPNTTLNEEVLQQASPLRGNNWKERAQTLEKLRHGGDNRACVLTEEFADLTVLGLAREIKRAVTEGDGTLSYHGKKFSVSNDKGEIDYRKVRSYLMVPLVTSVATHEIGHTLGLFHNFSGSYDALNYHPSYWQLRDDGNMASRAWDPISDREINGRIDEYSYSSVMDYSRDVILGQGHSGIGHYDRAAIKLGYADLVEVFEQVKDAAEVNLIGYLQRNGYPVRLTYNALAGADRDFDIKAYNYVDVVTQVVGGIDRLEKRKDVLFTSLQPDPVLTAQQIEEPMLDEKGRPAVPYRFCNDYLAEVGPDCQVYDAGADAYESVQSIADHYWNYHLFNAYRRERLGFEVDAYVDRILNRYLVKLQRVNQIYTLYRGLFEKMFEDNPSLEQFWVRPDGMGDWTAAVGSAYQLLTQIITTPEPGFYQSITRGDGTEALESSDNTASTQIDEYQGRHLETTWDTKAGYYYFENIERVGFYYDKVLALEMLTDPTTYFIARDTAPDVRTYQINYYSSFGPAVTNFFRGLLAEDWQTIAPRWYQDSLLQTNSFDMGLGARPGVPVDPNASFSIQLNAALLSMTDIPATYDRSFFNSARIFLRGSAESVALDPSLPTVEFIDPNSGLIYVAGSHTDSSGRETGIGAQMLKHAQQLLDNEATDALSRFIDIIDVVRRLTWRLGYYP